MLVELPVLLLNLLQISFLLLYVVQGVGQGELNLIQLLLELFDYSELICHGVSHTQLLLQVREVLEQVLKEWFVTEVKG